MKKIISCILFSVSLCNAKLPAFLEAPSPWADETIQKLTLEEKIAQCFMPVAQMNAGEETLQQIEMLIERYKVGGVFLGGPTTIDQQVTLVNRLQAASTIPLLVGQDQEFGPAMRVTDGMQWPFAMTLGAVPNDELVYHVARAMAVQARAIGVHVTATPVVDINSNPQNPIINIRSFGATREMVIPKALAMIQGLEEGGVLSCIKHFPGHGDTYLDSHKALPVIKHSQQRMFDVELTSFQAAIDAGTSVVMTGHLSVPAFDPTGTPATLSQPLIQDLLQHVMRFEGLVMTDSLTMKALPQLSPVEINLRALQAGNDLLIYATMIPETIHAIMNMLHQSDISAFERQQIEQAFTERAHKILKAKEWLGLHKNKRIDPKLAAVASETDEYDTLALSIYRSAITVVRDPQKLIPLQNLEHQKILVVTRGQADQFTQQFEQHKKAEHVLAESELNAQQLQDYDTILYVYVPPVLMVGGLAVRLLSGKLEPEVLTDLERLRHYHKPIIMVLCASPFLLYSLPADIPVLVAYEPHEWPQIAAADALCGTTNIVGKLPLILPDLSDQKEAREKDL